MSRPLRRAVGAIVLSGALVGGGWLAPAHADEPPPVDLGEPEPLALDLEGGAFDAGSAARPQATSRPRTTTVSPTAYGLVGMLPTRLVDTRSASPLVPSVPLTVPVAGVAGVGAGANAAVLNVTVTGSRQDGFVTASPCGAAQGTSNLNFSARQTIANLAVVGLGAGGAVCISSSVEAHVIVDITGYVATGGQLYTPVTPTRVLDTRPGGVAPVGGAPTAIVLAGQAGVPLTGARAAAVNVTITSPVAEGYATVYPCGTDVPLASNVNFSKGQAAAANGVVVGLDAGGALCVTSSVTAHLIVDVTGWFGATGTEVRAAPPVRLTDTRQGAGRVSAETQLTVRSAPDALGTVVNVTVTGSSRPGYLTVWPCGTAKPDTSALNFAAGQTIANAVLAPVSSSGQICISPSVDTHVIVDRTAVLGLAGSGNLDSTGSVVTDWALTQVGAVYAAMNPYRFGDSKYGKAWDCAPGETTCSKVDTQGATRTTSAGSFVYDCSGFVVAAWLRAGIDLVKLGASWTEPMLQKLPPVTRADAQVGDLVMFDFDKTDTDPVSHVGMYLADNEMVHAGTCKNGSGVCRTSINWNNVVAVLRPPAA